ncbi:MAG TPA: hypothetical protein VFK72_03810, partial [Nevskia sp.]|nr:hypothetical protein [Nevskia sp.]
LATTLSGRVPAAPARGPVQAHPDAVGRLERLLDEGNGDAVDLVREAAGALAAQLGEEGYRDVADRVEDFDFDGALALLRERAGG